MFKFVNGQADDIEQLEIAIQDMKDELKKYQGRGVVVADEK